MPNDHRPEPNPQPGTPVPPPPNEPAEREPAGSDVPGAAEDPAQVSRQRDEYRDQLQRCMADFINYQKRARAQAEIDRQFAVASLAEDLLTIIDNFERALDAARNTGDGTIVEGLELIHRQLTETLAKHGIEPMVALDQPFDPSRHEAVMQQPRDDVPEGTVVADLGRGYRLRDRVLRPTKVAVSIKP